MRFDKTKSCHHCPDRCVGCHGTCEGYQARVAEREVVYKERELRQSIRLADSHTAQAMRRKNQNIMSEQARQRNTGNRTDLKPDGTKYRHTHND